MNTKSRLLVLPVILAMTVGSLFADPKPALVVQVVSTEDQDAYLDLLAKSNTLLKDKTGLEHVRHAWVGDFAGDSSHGLFVVSQFASVAAAAQMQEKLKGDADIKALMGQFKAIRHLGPSYLYKGVRNDGVYDGGAVFNTSIVCSDEDAYVKALDGLKAIFDANGFKDARINLWRIAAGRSTATHLVVIAFPSQTRVAELIDAISDKALLKEWNVGAAKIRTTVHNGTYHEVTK